VFESGLGGAFGGGSRGAGLVTSSGTAGGLKGKEGLRDERGST
jgi:hypothetical protein